LPLLNTVWWLLASVFGIGAIVVAAWRARHGVALVPGGRGGVHRPGHRPAKPVAATIEAAPAARPNDMPLAED
jgi:hypothetical protein